MIEDASIFLSYNKGDKAYVRKLAAVLRISGAHVWFDEWTVRPGDSIPGAINEGLSKFDTFALIWSNASSKSHWVKVEMEAAVSRWMSDDQIRLIPVCLDDTELPPILRAIRYIDGSDEDSHRVARELLKIESETAFLLAVQNFIEEAGLEFAEFHGVGVLVACPKCGATVDKIKPWHQTDIERDDEYMGARCTVCGWNDGSEI